MDGQAAVALESIDIKDMCTEGGKELVFRELDQRFPDKVAADRMGEAMEEALDDGGFHWTIETCVQTERANLPTEARRDTTNFGGCPKLRTVGRNCQD